MLLFLPPLCVFAEETAALSEGVRVKVWSQQRHLRSNVGRLVALDTQSLVIDFGQTSAPTVLERAFVTRIQTSQGRKRHAKVGALIGLAAGAAIGALLHSSIEDAGECCSVGAFAGITGGIGAATGGLVGALAKTERWQDLPLAQSGMRTTPNRMEPFALALSVRF